MHVTPAAVKRQREWCLERSDRVVPLINDTRDALGEQFDVTVDPVTESQYCEVIRETFADGERAVNVAALVGILRILDVDEDYPGFIIDELLGRELAAVVAGNQPLRLLAEATFHYADVHTHGDTEDAAGLDDLEAALAAGAQTRLPGWPWREGASPYGIDRDR